MNSNAIPLISLHGIGYLWGANWASIANNAETAARALSILAVLVLGAVVLVRWFRQNHEQEVEQRPRA